MTRTLQLVLPLFSILLFLACCQPGHAGLVVTFEKIADTDTPIPGAPGDFTNLGAVSLDAGEAAFHGWGEGTTGLYAYSSGALTKIVDSNSPIPGGSGKFTSFGEPSLDGGFFAFEGGGDNWQGIYTTLGGELRVVADFNTSIPSGSGNFTTLHEASISESNVSFYGRGAGGQVSICIEKDGSLSAIADTSTPIPDGVGQFSDLVATNGTLDGIDTAFRGGGSNDQMGIYASVAGVVTKVVDRNTPVPGGSGNFRDFHHLDFDAGVTAIVAKGTDGGHGIYANNDGILKAIVDRGTPIPGGVGTFEGLKTPSLDDGNLAFEGTSSAQVPHYQQGIYTTFGGTLAKVIDNTDTLDGKTFDITSTGSFGVFEESLSGNSIAFRATFADESKGLYVAHMDFSPIPEPSTLILLAAGAIGLLSYGWRRRRKR